VLFVCILFAMAPKDIPLSLYSMLILSRMQEDSWLEMRDTGYGKTVVRQQPLVILNEAKNPDP
jgi:hypothetical protein